jgi:hypothetical protein
MHYLGEGTTKATVAWSSWVTRRPGIKRAASSNTEALFDRM